jgi:hypothetical protein
VLRVFTWNDEDCVDVILLIQFLNYCALYRTPDDSKDQKTIRTKPIKVLLYCTVSQPPVTATHTCTERVNFYIILGHYSTAWLLVYLESWSALHILVLRCSC